MIWLILNQCLGWTLIEFVLTRLKSSQLNSWSFLKNCRLNLINSKSNRWRPHRRHNLHAFMAVGRTTRPPSLSISISAPSPSPSPSPSFSPFYLPIPFSLSLSISLFLSLSFSLSISLSFSQLLSSTFGIELWPKYWLRFWLNLNQCFV